MPASTIEIVINGKDNASGVFNSVGNAMQGLGDKVTSAGRNLMGAGAAMSVVSAPLLGIGAAALKTAKDYEGSMNMLQAGSGATAAEMAKLGAMATALGADMQLPGTSASDAAEAMFELSKAGLDVNEVMAASKGVLQLSTAAQISNSQAALITARALNMFGLEGSEATRVADLLAAGANKSTASINDMAMGLQMSGSVAASMGLSIQDVTTSIALMANAGIAGSDAGTSLKTMLMRLASPTAEAAGKMAEMGVNIYDASGAMLPMPGIISQFTSSLAGMSQQQRTTAMETIFGSDAIRAGNILLGGGVAAWDAMKASVTAGGEAADMAAAKSAGLAGALDGMKSNIETLLLSAMQPFMQTISETGTQMGPLEVIVRQVATAFGNLTTWIQSADPAMVQAALAIAGMVAAAGPLLLILGAVVTAIGTLMSPIGLVIAAIVALAVAWATNFGGIRDATMPIIEAIIGAGGALVAWLRDELPAAIATLQAQWEPVWQAISDAVQTAMNIIAAIITEHGANLSALGATWEAIRNTIDGVVSAISRIVSTVFGAIATFLQSHGEEIKTFLGDAWTQAERIIGLAAELIDAMIRPIFEGIATFLSDHGAEIQRVLDVAWTAIKGIIQVALDLIEGVIKTALLIFKGDWSGAWDEMKATAERIWGTISAAIERIANDLAPILAAIWESIKTAAGEKWEAIKTAIAEKWDAIKTSIAEKVEAIKTAIITAWTDLKADIAQKWQDIKQAIADKIAEILTSVLTWLDNVFVAIESFDLQAAATTFFGTVIPGIVAKINEALDNVATWLSDTAANIAAFDLRGAATTAFATALSGISAKIAEALTAVATWLTDTFEKINSFDLLGAAITLFQTVVAGIIQKASEMLSEVGIFLSDIGFAISKYTFKSDTLTSLQTVIEGIIDKAVDILAAVGNFLEDIATKIKEFSLKEAAWSLIGGFIEGILESVDAVKDAIVSLIKAAIAAALAALNAGSPSRVFIAIGATIPQGLAIGILDGRGAVQGAMGSIADDITGVLDYLEEYIKIIVAWLNRLAAYFAGPDVGIGGAKAVVDALKPIFDGLADVLAGVQAVLTFELIADAAARVDAVIAFLKTQLPLLVAALATVSGEISDAALAAAQRLAVAVGAIGAAMGDIVAGFSAIAGYIPAGAGAIDQFVAFITTDLAALVAALAIAGSTFSTEALAAAVAFSEAAGAVMKILGDAIDAFAKLKDYDADFSLYAAGMWHLKEQIVNVTLWLARIAADFDVDAVPAVKAFEATAGAAMAVLSSAIDAFEKFQTFDADFSLYAAGLWRLKASIVNAVQWLARIAADFDVTALPAVTAFSAAATAAMGVLSSAIDAFSKFQEYDATFSLHAAGLWRLKASIVNMVEWLVRISADFDLTALPAVTAFSAAATAAMGVLSGAIDAFSKFQEYDATFNLYAAGLWRLKASIVNCVQWIMRMGEEMSVSGLAGAVAFAAAADAVMTMIGNAIDAFTALQGFEGVTLAAVMAFGEAMGTVVAIMAAIGSTFSTDGLAAATAFATAAGTIGGAIENAVTGLKLLMEFSGAISFDAMHAFQVAIWTMVAGLREVARGFDADGLAAATAFAAAASTIGGSIETALQGIQSLLAYAGGNITAAMALFVTDIQAVVAALGAANVDLQTGVLAATTFLALANSILASIASAATAMTTGLAAAGTTSAAAAESWLTNITAMDASLGGGQNILLTTALPAALQVATLGTAIGAAILAGATAAAAGANAGAAGVPGAMAVILASVVAAVTALQAQFAALVASSRAFGYNWVTAIIDGINSRLPDLVTLMAYIRGLFPSSPAKYGPFKTLPDGQTVGQDFAFGLTSGLLGGQAPLLGALGILRGAMTMSAAGGLQPSYAGVGTTNNSMAVNFSGPINARDDRDIERLANAVGDVLARQADINRRSGYRY